MPVTLLLTMALLHPVSDSVDILTSDSLVRMMLRKLDLEAGSDTGSGGPFARPVQTTILLILQSDDLSSLSKGDLTIKVK